MGHFLEAAVIVSTLGHWMSRRIWLAVLVTGPIAAGLYQVILRAQLGHMDPDWPLGVAMTTVIGWVISVIVGFIFSLYRALRRPPPGRPE